MVINHATSNETSQLLLLVTGKAGSGKSFLIDRLRYALWNQCVISALFGIAAYNISGKTLHYLLKLPIRGKRNHSLNGAPLLQMQQTFEGVKYLIIDEYSVVSQLELSWINRRCKQATGLSESLFGGLNIILAGDLGQLPPVSGKVLFHSNPTTELEVEWNNRYEVKLPFKENQAMIEDNYNLSVKRLDNLKRRLDKKPKLLQEYNEIIQSQIKADIVDKVESPGEVGAVTYLPHRAVVRDDKKSTKVRVVFDASAKNKGASLKECLYKGPCLNPLLYDVLLRFGVFNITITGDIEKAYLQISVHTEDRDYLRFLWFDDIYKDNPEILKYRFTRVIFGATCSQFLLNGT